MELKHLGLGIVCGDDVLEVASGQVRCRKGYKSPTLARPLERRLRIEERQKE